jgi:hypothetical protein
MAHLHRILITNLGSWNIAYALDMGELGIEPANNGSFCYDIVDEKKFMLAVVKYGIEYMKVE